MADLLAGARWEAVRTEPGVATTPADLAGHHRLAAQVPGTAAGVLREAGLSSDPDQQDWWWQTVLPAAQESRLVLDGVATVSEVWIGEEPVHHGRSMFVAAELTLDEVPAGTVLSICCRALAPLLAGRHPRPGWRTRLVATQNLRWFRTALLGRMPALPVASPAVGPWRAVHLWSGEPVLRSAVRAVGSRVSVQAELARPGSAARLLVGDQAVALALEGTAVHGEGDLAGLAGWLPHGTGEPVLHPWVLEVDGVPVRQGRLGLRSVTSGRPMSEGLALKVNGVPVFCRGAVWLPADPVTLQNDPVRLRAALTTLRDAGLNMLRLPGFAGYEDEILFDLCDELGLLIWQDLAMANLDPPAGDAGWRDLLATELDQLGRRLAAHPCVVVVCGGSETEQQAAMVGADTGALQTFLGQLAAAFPDVVWVDNSPTGGPRPFSARPGVTHWFGVGAYLRPLAEGSTADVGFASECLAFAVPADPEGVRELAGSPGSVPRDVGASWDFQDVTDHYVRTLLGADPAAVRWTEPELASDLARAAVVECVTSTLAAWRSPATVCAGGLLLAARDLAPGAGWGLLDAADRPKAVLQALPDVLAPTALLVQDRGLDGVLVHLVSDAAAAADTRLQIDVYDLDSALVLQATVAVSETTIDLESALGGFCDLNHAHAFGPARFDVLHLRLLGPQSQLAEATHLLGGPRRPRVTDVGLAAVLDGDAVVVSTVAAAQRVAFDVPGFAPVAGWFHLAPGCSRRVPLRGEGVPRGEVRALNSRRAARLVLP
jgi:beta-mannosidase